MSGCDCVRCQTEGCDDSELCGCCLNAEVERLTTAIKRVRELHRPTVDTVDVADGWEDVEHCYECGHIYEDAEPCPTIRAIEGEL